MARESEAGLPAVGIPEPDAAIREPAAIRRPSGLKAIKEPETTFFENGVLLMTTGRTGWLESQIFCILAKLLEARVSPSGMNESDEIDPPWSLNVRNSRPESISQTFTTASEPAETSWRPSTRNARAVTLVACPESWLRGARCRNPRCAQGGQSRRMPGFCHPG